MEQVLDVVNALHAPRALLEVADHLRLADFAAEDDLAVFGVHVDLTLRDLCVAEDLALDLARQRDVVRLTLRLLERLCAAGQPRQLVLQQRAAARPLLRVEEVGQRGAEADQTQKLSHRGFLSSLLRMPGTLPPREATKRLLERWC